MAHTNVVRLARPEQKKTPFRASLTIAFIDGLYPPASGWRAIYDAKTPGLCVRITAGGAKTFYFARWGNGRPVRVKLGGFPDISVEQARKLAAKMSGEIADGKDPSERRRAQRAAATFGQLFDGWIERYATPKLRTWEESAATFKRYFESWRGRKVNAITTDAIEALHVKLGKDSGHFAANRAVELVRTLFAWAKVKPNPAAEIKPFDEPSRDRFVTPTEMPRLFEALDDEPSAAMRDFFKLLIFTGARRANVLAMRWEDIDLHACTWRVPSEASKSKKTLYLPLNDSAAPILAERYNAADAGDEWVFPSDAASGHMQHPERAWRGVRERCGINDIRMHDLRRTFGSYLAIQGVSLPQIGALLGHGADSSATAIYARLLETALRGQSEQGSAAIVTLAAAKPKRTK